MFAGYAMKSFGKNVKLTLMTLAATLVLVLSPKAASSAQAATLGIDVSSYQGTIDWNAVAKSGVKFAMVRVGNTAYGLDSMFAYNMNGAAAAGLRVGCYVYSYAQNATQAAADAQLAINAMAPFGVSFPVAIDIEDPSQVNLSTAQQQEIINTFCAMIYNAGYTPMVYSYKNWFATKLGVVAWDSWVANYSSSMGYPGTMWQWSSSGSVPGISGRVDMNYVLKDYFTEIQANGLVERNGKQYLFRNYKRQVGLQNVNGVNYLFGADGAMVKDATVTDGAGNIIRMKKNGEVVIITIQAQQLAVQTQTAYDQAKAVLAQAQADEAAYQAQLQQIVATRDAAGANVAAGIPGFDEVYAIAQTQADTLTAQTNAAHAAVQTAQAALAQAKAANDAAQAAIVIPQ